MCQANNIRSAVAICEPVARTGNKYACVEYAATVDGHLDKIIGAIDQRRAELDAPEAATSAASATQTESSTGKFLAKAKRWGAKMKSRFLTDGPRTRLSDHRAAAADNLRAIARANDSTVFAHRHFERARIEKLADYDDDEDEEGALEDKERERERRMNMVGMWVWWGVWWSSEEDVPQEKVKRVRFAAREEEEEW